LRSGRRESDVEVYIHLVSGCNDLPARFDESFFRRLSFTHFDRHCVEEFLLAAKDEVRSEYGIHR